MTTINITKSDITMSVRRTILNYANGILRRTLCSTSKNDNEPHRKTIIAKPEFTTVELESQKFEKPVSIREFLPKTNLPEFWNERTALRKSKKLNSVLSKTDSLTGLIKVIQDLNSLPKSLAELRFWAKLKLLKKELIEQKFLPQRVMVLKPDLAAAHFITHRGGSVKFVNHPSWIGKNEAKSLPLVYTPGHYIERINAEGTELRREGLKNIAHLRHLSWLSLKNLKEIDDWCIDWIVCHFPKLEYLDISGCTNITHRGLSCFYKFDSLKVLIAEGVSDTPEFKVACLMLQDIMPELKIGGIDLRIPEKIDSVEIESPKDVSDNQKNEEENVIIKN